MGLKGSKTEKNLKDAFAREAQTHSRYLYFANKADTGSRPWPRPSARMPAATRKRWRPCLTELCPAHGAGEGRA